MIKRHNILSNDSNIIANDLPRNILDESVSLITYGKVRVEVIHCKRGVDQYGHDEQVKGKCQSCSRSCDGLNNVCNDGRDRYNVKKLQSEVFAVDEETLKKTCDQSH